MAARSETDNRRILAALTDVLGGAVTALDTFYEEGASIATHPIGDRRPAATAR